MIEDESRQVTYMPAEDRSFSDVFQDILHNVQDIVRSEVRLAKTEIREEVGEAKSSAVMLGGGALTAIFALLFLLLTLAYALALVMPSWAAALIVGAALAVIATLMLITGRRRFKQIHPTPGRTVETIKENVEWAKQQVK
jgi:uncharacterized membrane protein YqjE